MKFNRFRARITFGVARGRSKYGNPDAIKMWRPQDDKNVDVSMSNKKFRL